MQLCHIGLLILALGTIGFFGIMYWLMRKQHNDLERYPPFSPIAVLQYLFAWAGGMCLVGTVVSTIALISTGGQCME